MLSVLLWEMFTREVPYHGLTEFKIYSIISQHGVKLVIPDTCPDHLAKWVRGLSLRDLNRAMNIMEF